MLSPPAKKRHRAAHLHPLACPAHLPPSQQEPSSHHLSFPLPPRRLSAGGAAQQPANFGPTSEANPVRSGTGGGGWDYVDIAGFLERYGSWGVWERVGTRARPQRDRTACTMCASRLARSPVCTRGEPCSPLDPEWGPVAPTSPRCWSSENKFNQVSWAHFASPLLSPPLPPWQASRRAVQRAAPAPRSAALATPWAPSHICGLFGQLLFEESIIACACMLLHTSLHT